MGVEVIGNGGPDGTTLGRAATEKISFYGATTIVKPSSAYQGALSLTTATGSSGFGFSTSAAFTAFVNQLENIRASLVSLGLLKGSA